MHARLIRPLEVKNPTLLDRYYVFTIPAGTEGEMYDNNTNSEGDKLFTFKLAGASNVVGVFNNELNSFITEKKTGR
jgi:hypothetical protein